MTFKTADLCDDHEGKISVVEPLFGDFGGNISFSGKIFTIKCFEDNSLVGEALKTPGEGRVLVVDGGGSIRKALVGDLLAQAGADNNWSGIVVNGCIRDSRIISKISIGCKALATFPMKTDKKGVGEQNLIVHFADVDFIPDHYLYADEDGIIVSANNLLS
jgi:regulator of ribonuclease activity A